MRPATLALPCGDLPDQHHQHERQSDQPAELALTGNTALADQLPCRAPQSQTRRARTSDGPARSAGGPIEQVRGRGQRSGPIPEGDQHVGGRMRDLANLVAAGTHRGPCPLHGAPRDGHRVPCLIDWQAVPADQQLRQRQVGGEFAPAVEDRLPGRVQFTASANLVADRIPGRPATQLSVVAGPAQRRDERLGIGARHSGLPYGTGQLDPRRLAPLPPPFSSSPRDGAGAAVPSAPAVSVSPNRRSIPRAASRSREYSRYGQNRRHVPCRPSTTAM